MMTTFKEWARKDGAKRTVRIEFSLGFDVYKFSNTGYDGNDGFYPGRIKGDVNSSFSVPRNRFMGLGDESFGTVTLYNISGDLDFLTDLNAEGEVIKIDVGAKDDSVTFKNIINDAVIKSIVSSPNGEVQINIIYKSHYLDSIYNKGYYGSDDLNPGLIKPIALGDVFGLPPTKVENPSTFFPGGVFQVSEVAGIIRNVFDDGMVLTKAPQLATFPLDPGEWHPDPYFNPKFFRLGSLPSGKLTADFTSSSALMRPDQILRDVYNSVLPTNITVSSPIGSASVSTNHMNLFINTEITARDIIKKITDSVVGYAVFDPEGDVIFGAIKVPDQGFTPDLFLTEDDIGRDPGDFTLVRKINPFDEVSIRFFHNPVKHDFNAAPSPGFEYRTGRLAEEWVIARVSGANPSVKKFAKNAPIIESFLHGHHIIYDNDPLRWGDDIVGSSRPLGILRNRENKTLAVWRVNVSFIGIEAKLGSTINITHKRFGFHDGRNVIIIRIEPAIGTSNRVILFVMDKSNSEGIFASAPRIGNLGGTLGKFTQEEISVPPLPAEGNERTSTNPNDPPQNTEGMVFDEDLGQWVEDSETFLNQDENTEQIIDMVALTSESSTSTGQTWTLFGDDLTGTDTIIMDGVSKEIAWREFNGSTYIQANNPIIDNGFGPHTVEMIMLFPGNDNVISIFGNRKSASPEDGFSLRISPQGTGFYLLDGRSRDGGSVSSQRTLVEYNFANPNSDVTNKWAHVVMTYNPIDRSRRIAWKIEGLVTSMDADTVGNDALATSYEGHDSYEPGRQMNFTIGHGHLTSVNAAFEWFTGKVAEFKISNNAKYQSAHWSQNTEAYVTEPGFTRKFELTGSGSITGTGPGGGSLTENGSVGASFQENIFGSLLNVREFDGTAFFEQTVAYFSGSSPAAWTIEFFIKPTDFSTKQYVYSTIDMLDQTGRNGWAIRIEIGGRVKLILSSGVASIGGSKFFLNEWNHVILRKYNNPKHGGDCIMELISAPFYIKTTDHHNSLLGKTRISRGFGVPGPMFTGVTQKIGRVGGGYDADEGATNFKGLMSDVVFYDSDRFIFPNLTHAAFSGLAGDHTGHTAKSSPHCDELTIVGERIAFFHPGTGFWYYLSHGSEEESLIPPHIDPPSNNMEWFKRQVAPYEWFYREVGSTDGNAPEPDPDPGM